MGMAVFCLSGLSLVVIFILSIVALLSQLYLSEYEKLPLSVPLIGWLILFPVFIWGLIGYGNAYDNKVVWTDKVVIKHHRAWVGDINLTAKFSGYNFQDGEEIELTRLGSSGVGLDFTNVIHVEYLSNN